MSRAVLDNAVELDAVPCGVGSHRFTGVRPAVPHREGALSLFPEIPLVAQSRTGCLKRQGDGIARRNGLIDGLDGDGKHADAHDRGIHPVARAVRHAAIELNAVPCDIRRDGFAGVRPAVPYVPRCLSLLFVIPLVGKTAAACFDADRRGASIYLSSTTVHLTAQQPLSGE